MSRGLLWGACLAVAALAPARAQTVYASTGRAIVAIDGRTDVPAARGEYAGLAVLPSLALAAQGRRLEIVSREVRGSDRLLDYDAASLTQIGSTDIRGPLHAVVASPDGRLAYCLSEHRISVVDVVAHAVLRVIPQNIGLADAAITPDGRMLFIAERFGTDVLAFDTGQQRVVETIHAGRALGGVAMSQDGAHAYVADQDGRALLVMNTATRKVEASIPVDRGPDSVAVTPDGKTAYAGLSEPGRDGVAEIAVIDLARRKVTRNLPAPGRHLKLAVSADGAKLYAASDSAHSIEAFDTRSATLLHTIKLAFSGVFALAISKASPGLR